MLVWDFPKPVTLSLQLGPISMVSVGTVSFKTQTGTESDTIIHVLNHMSTGQKTRTISKDFKMPSVL